MAQMNFNAGILAFGYSGMVAPHPSTDDQRRGSDAQAAEADRNAYLPVRSLLVRLRNPRL